MEDKHIANTNFEQTKDCYLFAVFDGHGGNLLHSKVNTIYWLNIFKLFIGKEVSTFCEAHFAVELEKNENFTKKNFEIALTETF